MTIIYKEVISAFGEKFIERTNDDGTFTYIPCDPTNSDYQAYLNPTKENGTLS